MLPSQTISSVVFVLEFGFVGTVLSAIAHGIVIVLFVRCLRRLRHTSVVSNKKKGILVTYITFMFLVSTVGLVLCCIIFSQAMSSEDPANILFSHLGRTIVVPYVFSLWGADGMMTWRCLILYEGMSRFRSAIIKCVLGTLVLISLASGIILFVLVFSSNYLFASIFMVILPGTTSFTNILFACLISGRLVWHQTWTKRALGKTHGSPYTSIITICVESCLVIVLFSVSFLVLRFVKPEAAVIPELLLMHVSAISSLILLQRVFVGRDAIQTINTREIELKVAAMLSDMEHHPRRPAAIQFISEGTTEPDV